MKMKDKMRERELNYSKLEQELMYKSEEVERIKRIMEGKGSLGGADNNERLKEGKISGTMKERPGPRIII